MTVRSTLRPGAMLGAELTESQAALRVFLAAGGLAVLGLALLLLTIWWWRGTRPEPPALGPLEVMGDRRWAAAPEPERRRMLQDYRPEGSESDQLYIQPEPVDLASIAREAPRSFDDLRDPVEENVIAELVAGASAPAADLEHGGPAAEPLPQDSPSVDGLGSEFDGTVAMVAPDVEPDDEELEGAATSSEGRVPGEAGIEASDVSDVPGVDVAASVDEVDEVEPVDATVAMLTPDRRSTSLPQDGVDR